MTQRPGEFRELVISDLVADEDGQPRVDDLLLGAQLGYGRVRNIRDLIERHRAELDRYGGLSWRRMNPGPEGGRPGRMYRLNQNQALVICSLSDTPNAADVRYHVITLFSKWRDERLRPPPRAPDADGALLDEDEGVVFDRHRLRTDMALLRLVVDVWGVAKAQRVWSDVAARNKAFPQFRPTGNGGAPRWAAERFIDEMIEPARWDAWVPTGAIYRAYERWCAERGEDTVSHERLGGLLKARGYTAGHKRLGGKDPARVYFGLALRPAASASDVA